MKVFIFLLFFCAISCKQENKPLSLPEEIGEARQGDLLYVEKVTDSIYLGFKH